MNIVYGNIEHELESIDLNYIQQGKDKMEQLLVKLLV